MKAHILAIVTTGVVVASGCATGRIARVLRPLPKCAAEQIVPPPEWRREPVGNGFLVALPPSCGAEEVRPSVHGAKGWSCGPVVVSVYWGMWGLDDDESPRSCKAERGGLPMVVTRDADGSGEAVWYLTGHVHEPIVRAAAASPADPPAVHAITRSGVLEGPRGPNR